MFQTIFILLCIRAAGGGGREGSLSCSDMNHLELKVLGDYEVMCIFQYPEIFYHFYDYYLETLNRTILCTTAHFLSERWLTGLGQKISQHVCKWTKL